MMLELFVGTCVIAIILFVRHYQIRKQYPPGPLGLPFLGILPFKIIQYLLPNMVPKISDRMFFTQMKAKYGDVWSFELGDIKHIVLASIEAVNETIVDEGKLFSGRPPLESFKVRSGNCGIVFIGGTVWNENRQLAIKALRDLGMGRQTLKDDICDESHELIDYIEKNLSTPFINPSIFVKATSNVISKLAFQERISYDDPELTDYLKNVKFVLSSYMAQTLIDFFPNFYKSNFIRNLFPIIDKFIDCNNKCVKFIANKCRSRIKVESEYTKPSCVFDFFWRYRYQDEPDISYDEKFHNICQVMYDLFDAGIDTATNTIGFSCLILGQNPVLQSELRKEIHLLADDYKSITLEMKKDCPRLQSFIDEVQRFCYLVPLALHQALEAHTFRGYKIKTSDAIVVDLATISRDPRHFENPDTFDPYRFLDKTRTKYIPNKSFIPFGTGKRFCLGESIAMMEMFMFLPKIIHKFDILLTKKTEDNIAEILEGKFGIVHVPLEHEIIFKLNKAN